MGVLAALEKGELTCEALRKALVLLAMDMGHSRYKKKEGDSCYRTWN